MDKLKFYPVYKDEDDWYRFDILTLDGDLFKSGEYAHEINAERDKAHCIRKNSIDNIEKTLLKDGKSLQFASASCKNKNR